MLSTLGVPFHTRLGYPWRSADVVRGSAPPRGRGPGSPEGSRCVHSFVVAGQGRELRSRGASARRPGRDLHDHTDAGDGGHAQDESYGSPWYVESFLARCGARFACHGRTAVWAPIRIRSGCAPGFSVADEVRPARTELSREGRSRETVRRSALSGRSRAAGSRVRVTLTSRGRIPGRPCAGPTAVAPACARPRRPRVEGAEAQ